jgi:hypothetical protein
MALVLADRVQQTGTANTTVSFTLSGSVTGFQSFSTIGDTNTTYYAATDASGNWETGVGTYSTTGPTLTRTTILSSSNSGSAVTFSGTVNVFVTYPATESVTAGNVQTFLSSGTWTNPSTTAYQFVRIQMWGGGGGGSRTGANIANIGAGGGGGYVDITVPIASMGATATVTVGSAGTGRTGSTGSGGNGGNSAVTLGSGSIVYASGGIGAVNDSVGGDGGVGGIVFTTTTVGLGGSGATGSIPAGDGYSYGGGGGGTATNNTGGKGGYGGGGGTRGAGAGGTSIFGGAGGNATTAGTQPGGGGGASSALNTNATSGGAGQVIITTF